jgi:hypothetical protein
MKSWTIEEMLAENPCERYTDHDNARLRKIWGKRKRLSLADLCRDRRLPLVDRIWAICRPSALTPRSLSLRQKRRTDRGGLI